MADALPVNISDSVADTLFIPLYMRNLETKRLDCIINDPLACELVERIEYDFAKYTKFKASQIGTSIRIRQFDRAVRRFVKANKNPVVISIGAGLDTRFQRVYSGKGVFYEIDLPEVIELRKQLLPESEHNPYMAVSMFDTVWIDTITAKHPDASYIIVAEGVFMYFEEKELRPLIVEIAERMQGELHFDACSPWAARNSSKHETVKFTNARFKWGIRSDDDLQNWSPRLQHKDTAYYMNQEKHRWGFQGVIARIIPKFGKAYCMLHYDIA